MSGTSDLRAKAQASVRACGRAVRRWIDEERGHHPWPTAVIAVEVEGTLIIVAIGEEARSLRGWAKRRGITVETPKGRSARSLGAVTGAAE